MHILYYSFSVPLLIYLQRYQTPQKDENKSPDWVIIGSI